MATEKFESDSLLSQKKAFIAKARAQLKDIRAEDVSGYFRSRLATADREELKAAVEMLVEQFDRLTGAALGMLDQLEEVTNRAMAYHELLTPALALARECRDLPAALPQTEPVGS